MARTRRSSVGIVDLARELGVSTATVSRALNGSPAVRPDVAERVRAHATERGYLANRLASALSANTSRAFVGFVIPYVDTPAYSAVAAECARLLSAGGTQMILTITENDPDRELQQVRELVASRVAGLVISPSTHVHSETRRLLATVPAVELHRSADLGGPGVFADDGGAMAEAVEHLAGLGHTEIAYVGTAWALSNGATRLRGVRTGMTAAGLDPDRLHVRLVEPTRPNGRDAAAELLRGPATALLGGGGSLSVGVAEAAHASGRTIPDDLSLVVYGDPAWFTLSDPPLTIVEVDYAELARRAAGLLLDALESPGTAGSEPVLVPARLRVAGSTGAPPEEGGR